MSISGVSVKSDPQTAKRVAPRAGAVVARWTRVLLVGAVLVASGAYRWRQSDRIVAWLEIGKKAPFHLENLPLELGSWKGEPATFDPQIARRTGATESLFRRYVNQGTGVRLDVIVLYGSAAHMYIHMPELCYPLAGYDQAEGPDDRLIATDRLKFPFRALVYTKGEGGQAERQEVYYSWRYNDKWTPKVGNQKQFERIPGMFKVHVARHLTDRERRDVGNPCEAFLETLLPEIERRLAAASPPSSTSPNSRRSPKETTR